MILVEENCFAHYSLKKRHMLSELQLTDEVGAWSARSFNPVLLSRTPAAQVPTIPLLWNICPVTAKKIKNKKSHNNIITQYWTFSVKRRYNKSWIVFFSFFCNIYSYSKSWILKENPYTKCNTHTYLYLTYPVTVCFPDKTSRNSNRNEKIWKRKQPDKKEIFNSISELSWSLCTSSQNYNYEITNRKTKTQTISLLIN